MCWGVLSKGYWVLCSASGKSCTTGYEGLNTKLLLNKLWKARGNCFTGTRSHELGKFPVTWCPWKWKHCIALGSMKIVGSLRNMGRYSGSGDPWVLEAWNVWQRHDIKLRGISMLAIKKSFVEWHTGTVRLIMAQMVQICVLRLIGEE